MASSSKKRRPSSSSSSASGSGSASNSASSSAEDKKKKSNSKSKPSEKKLAYFEGEYKGSPIFEIWAVDKKGNKEGNLPAFSFGVGKAKLITKFEKEIKAFVKENS